MVNEAGAADLGEKAMRGWNRFTGAALAGAVLCLATTASGQNGPAPGFEVVNSGAGIEVRFHGVPLKSVRADDAQNALALDFSQPIDPAIFDRLNGALPGWIAMAYANYDNGVIRAARPVTFLTRPEIDGFSLRLEPRGPVAAPMQPAPFQQAPYQPQGAPYPAQGGSYPQQPQQPYPPQNGPPQNGPPQGANAPPPGPQSQAQPPVPFAAYETYAAARNYYGLEYAVRRGDPTWTSAYQRAAMRSDSDAGLGVEYRDFHNGDHVLNGHGSFKVTLGAGVSLLGSIYETSAKGTNVRNSAGTFTASSSTNQISGSAGIGLETGGDSEITLEGLVGNGTGGGKIGVYQGSPDGFFSATLLYHAADLTTPESLLNKAVKDEAVFGVGRRLGWGLWGSLGARYTNYSLTGHSNVAQTAGWDGNLRWDAELVPGLFAGISYDGQGEYRLKYNLITPVTLTSDPTPYVPLSLRNLEDHAATASLSASLWDQIWLDAFGGYVYDRYAKTGGGLYGASLRVTPAPGFEIELGARHSNISLLQGELGGETSGGISLNIGFGGSPRANRFSLW